MKRGLTAVTIAALVLMSGIAFADTGVFINKAVLLDKDNENVTTFDKGDRVYISEENENQYTVYDNERVYYVDKQDLLLTTKKVKIYKVKNNATTMYSEPRTSSSPIKELAVDEVLYLESLSEEFGLFKTKEQETGYVILSALMESSIEKENITYGIATASMTIKNSANKYLHIKKSDILYIKDFRDNQYIILDEGGNEFLLNPLLVSFNKESIQASRSTFNRRTATNISKVVEYAYNSIGKPYVYGDSGKKGYDCSGLVYAAYLQIGVKLPRSSSQQASSGVKVNKEDLSVGDLVFFNTNGKGISHVGIYIGDGKMIHSSTGSKKVKIDEINSSYYGKRYVTARRIIEY